MTKEDIKYMITVPEILSKYGVIMKNGRCKSICHVGHNYTAKVSNQLYYCFKCNRRMDIFDITMHFNQCNFKTALDLLSSEKNNNFTANRIAKQLYRESIEKSVIQKQLEKELKHILECIGMYRSVIEKQEPFSDLWCYCHNKLQYQLYMLEIHNEKR